MRIVIPILAVIVAAVGTSVARHQESGLKARTSDEGDIGTPYAMGSPQHELAVTLAHARVTLRYPLADDEVLAETGDRLLVLRLAVANPLKKLQQFGAAGLRIGWTTEDETGVVEEVPLYLADGGDPVSIDLVPHQKIETDAVLRLPAKGKIHSVWIQRGPVKVHYPLDEVLPKLVDVFADKDGQSARDIAEVKWNQVFAMGAFDWKILKLTSRAGLPQSEDDRDIEDEVTLTADVSVRNAARRSLPISWNQLTARLTDTLGNEYRWETTLDNGRGDSVNEDLESGAVSTFRLVFQGPRDAEPALLTIEDDRTKRSVVVRLRPIPMPKP